MALYTGKGDTGTTKVLDSKERFSKGSLLSETLGSLDELNSWLGFVRASASIREDWQILVGNRKIPLTAVLYEVQESLFIVQAQVAGAKKKIAKTKVTKMERLIDTIEKEIPKITGFTIAGASEISAQLDVARTIARRVERRVVLVHEEKERRLTVDTLAYMNRLSSLLFALARLSAHRSGIKETTPSYR